MQEKAPPPPYHVDIVAGSGADSYVNRALFLSVTWVTVIVFTTFSAVSTF